MNLLLDCGNTRFKWAIADNREVVTRGVGEYVKALGVLTTAVSGMSIERVAVSSVASEEQLDSVLSMCEALSLPAVAVAKVKDRACGVRNNYQSIEQLGVDRWVAVIGAAGFQQKNPVIVVDAGTAITVDFLSTNASYEGGVILPGLALMHDSLVGRTAGIFSERVDVGSVFGKTTSECVNAGAFYGAVGAVEKVVAKMLSEMDPGSEPKILVCGGDAEHFRGLLKPGLDVLWAPDLIFIGLLAMLNQGEFS